MRKQNIHVFLGGRLGNQLFIVSAVSRVVEFLVSCGKSPNVIWYYHDASTTMALKLIAFEWPQTKVSMWTSSLVPVWIKDSRLYHRFLALFLHYLKKRSYVLPELRSAVSFPLTLKSRSIAFLGFYHDFQWVQETSLPPSIDFQQPKFQDSRNVIGVHFRFGDFQDESLKRKYGEISVDYYESALQFICNLLGDSPLPKILVFTDDVTLAKTKLRRLSSTCKFEVHFAAQNRMSLEKELALFASSKFLILSNSSFSWWAGYFSYSDALVIAPMPIYENENNERVACGSWIRFPGYS